MKKFLVVFIAAFSFIAVGLVVLMVCAINGNLHVASSNNSEAELVNTQKISLDNINSIQISYYSDDVEFYTSDTDELVLKEYRVNHPEKNDLAKIMTNGDKLSIKGAKWNMHFTLFGFSNNDSRVEVYLPADYAGALTVSTSSGDVDSDMDFKLTKFNLSCTSGDIVMNKVTADEINVSTSSGEITLQSAEGKRQISSTSGDIKVYGGSGDSDIEASSGEIAIEGASGKLGVDTTSGDISITAIDGGANISTTSGEIKYELEAMTDDISIDTTSGDVTLRLPETAGFDFKANTTSGDIDTFFNDSLSFNIDGDSASGTVGENQNKSVRINTTSGEINVVKK